MMNVLFWLQFTLSKAIFFVAFFLITHLVGGTPSPVIKGENFAGMGRFIEYQPVSNLSGATTSVLEVGYEKDICISPNYLTVLEIPTE